MNRLILNSIHSLRSIPSISLLMPTHRSFPENQQDKIRLKNLVKNAAERLSVEFSNYDTKAIKEKLNSLTEETDFNHLQDGLAYFISNENFYRFFFPFPVKEKVIIGDNFYTRDLIFGLNRTPLYFAVVIDEKNTRIFSCVRDNINEAVHSMLPLKNIVHEIREGDYPDNSYNDRIRENEERTKNHLRDTYKILKELTGANRTPVVVCGTERQISFFRDICTSEYQFIGEITGNYGSSSAAELAPLIWRTAKSGFAEIRKKILNTVDHAVSAKKFATGLQEIWNLVSEGRGLTLLTEINHSAPGIIKDGHVEITDTFQTGGTEDVIDEIIEMVFSKGGNVVFFDKDVLQQYGRIALILRY